MKEKLKIFLITIAVIVCLMVVLFIGGVIANDLGVTDITRSFALWKSLNNGYYTITFNITV